MLDPIRDIDCSKFSKLFSEQAPAHLFNEFSHSRDFHSYNTRHRDLLPLPLARTTKYQGSFRFSGAKFWNTFPLDLTSEHDINKKNRGIFWRWIRHCARKRSAAKIFPKLTQVSLLVGYQNFVGSVWYQIKAFCCEAPSARERSPIAKKIWLFIYPRSFGWHVILRPPVPALRPHHREANVKCHTF